MKTLPNPTPTLNHLGLWRFAPLFTGLAVLMALLIAPSMAWAQIQLLANPGAETGSFSGWTTWNDEGYNYGVVTASQAPPHSGTYSFWIFGDYSNGNGIIYNGFFQTDTTHAGEVFSANGWVYQLPTDSFNVTGDGNHAYIEVQFKDINGNVLSDYQSAWVTNGSPTGVWYDLQVTNETSPTAGYAATLVAPANAAQIEYDVVFVLDDVGSETGGSTYWDDLSLLSYAPPAPYVTNATPSNVILATNNTFTFSAVSPSGNITNLAMTIVAGSGLANPTTNTLYFTNSGPNLTISGMSTPVVNVSYPLASNTTYAITIQAIDSNGGLALDNVAFDTFQPPFVWEAEDFNFSSGQFIPTPPDGGVDLYSNQVGSASVDENWITASGQTDLYRPSDKVSIGGAYEIPRQKFLNAIADGSNTNALDYEVGYNNVGDWENYTRTFPTGNYNIYARMAVSGAGNQVGLAVVGGDPTSEGQTTTNLGVCNVSGNNWNQYFYCPMVDSFGNLVTVHLSGTETLRSTVTAGGPNINFYMIMPATGSPYPALISSYPTGTHPFEPGTNFSFTLGPANGSIINSNSISLILNGINVTSQLKITAGVSNQWTGSVPVSPSTIYAAVINVTNTTSLHSTFSINFDTFSQTNFMFEAEDFDFDGGMFIDNPMPSFDPTISGGGLLEPNSYCGFPEGNTSYGDIPGTDDGWVNVSGQTEVYRVSTVGTQVASDYLRQKFLDAQTALSDPNIADVNIGYWTTGSWLNYTRTYPAGTFNVWGRLAGGAGPFSGTTLAAVTSGAGTSTQTTNILGSFADPNAAGWQSWHWVELMTNDSPAVITLGGVSTLQIESGNNVNANFYMLVPAAAPAAPVTLKVALNAGQPAITFNTSVGHNYTLYYKNNLTDATWISVGSVAGDGSAHTVTDTSATGMAHRFYVVQIQ